MRKWLAKRDLNRFDVFVVGLLIASTPHIDPPLWVLALVLIPCAIASRWVERGAFSTRTINDGD